MSPRTERLARGSGPLKACDRVGPGAVVDVPPTIENGGRIEIGARFRLASLPVPSHLITGPEGVLAIGDDVSIGHGAAFAAFGEVRVGDRTSIGPFVVVMDTDFHVAGKITEVHRPVPVVIGRDVRIGSRVTLLRGSIVEDGAQIEAGTVVSGRVAAGSRVAGVPARVVVTASAGVPDERDVPRVVQETLGLRALPQASDGPARIPEWDSLGALKLLLALEETYGVTLAEDDVARVKNVADLEIVVGRALAAREAAAP